MADDIQIKSGMAGATPTGGTPTGGAQQAGQQPQTPVQQTVQQPASTENSPVIDLRQIDLSAAPQQTAETQTPIASAPATPAAAPAALPAAQAVMPISQPAAQPASIPPLTSASLASGTATGFNLEEAALAASQQNVMAPPDKFAVPEIVKQKFPDLIQLIKETESMTDEERDYWFQILPIMTEDQISKFRDILLNEKTQLQKLDQEYESELTKLNEKHMVEWKDFESKEKRKALVEAEAAAKQQEQATEEELLKRLGST